MWYARDSSARVPAALCTVALTRVSVPTSTAANRSLCASSIHPESAVVIPLLLSAIRPLTSAFPAWFVTVMLAGP